MTEGLRSPLRVIVYTDAVELGGAELSAANLVAAFSSRVVPVVVGVDEHVTRRIASGRGATETVVLPEVRGKWDVARIAALIRALRRARPDVIHLSLASPWSCQYALAASLALPRTPVVAVYQLAVPAVNRRQRLLKRLTARRVTAHVAVGERSADEVAVLTGIGRDSFRIVHNSVPDPLPLASSERLADGDVVLGLGRLERQKGFDVLVRALPELPGVTAVLAGGGSERASLEALAAEIGVRGRVVFAGWRDDPRAMLGGADVLAVPSRFEGFPLVVVEAMLARLPVVATDVGSVGEAVIDGETGLLVRPDDPGALAVAIRRLLEDAPFRARLGESGRAFAISRFTSERMAESFEHLYDEVRGARA